MVVDVLAVGFGIEHNQIGPQLAQNDGCHGILGAIGAVQQDAQAAEVQAGLFVQEVADVFLGQFRGDMFRLIGNFGGLFLQ